MSTRNVILMTAALAAVMLSAAAFFIGEPAQQPTVPPTTQQQQPDRASASSQELPPLEAPAPSTPEAEDQREQGQRLEGDEGERREAHLRETALGQIRKALGRSEDDPGNLQKFFDQLDRICAGLDDCDELLDEALENVDAERAAMIRRIRERLPAYEEQMQRTRMSMDTPPRERYERIHNLREEMLGTEETEAMFGQERAFAEYRFGIGDLAAQAENMSPQQRREALEQVREESFGEYRQQLVEEEGTMGRYRHELELMLVGVENDQVRDRITREVRERHLDPETIERMEQRDARQEQQQSQVADYQRAVEELEQQMEARREAMPPEQWEQEYQERMSELRREHFE